MIYTDIVEYNIVGDKKTALLRCFPMLSKLKGGDMISPAQLMNYISFENLQFHKLLKNSFQSIQIEICDERGELIPFFSVGITRLTLIFRKIS